MCPTQKLPLQDDSSQVSKAPWASTLWLLQLKPHPCALVSRQRLVPSTSPSSKGSGSSPLLFLGVGFDSTLPASLVREIMEAFPGVQVSLRL